jgi:hypothetical protein
MRPEIIRPFLADFEQTWAPLKEKAGREESALYTLLHGSMLRVAGDVEAGTKELEQAAKESTQPPEFKHEKHVAAFAYTELAELAYARRELKECERMLNIASKHTTGLWEDLLRPRTKQALDQVRNEIAHPAPAAAPTSS